MKFGDLDIEKYFLLRDAEGKERAMRKFTPTTAQQVTFVCRFVNFTEKNELISADTEVTALAGTDELKKFLKTP